MSDKLDPPWSERASYYTGVGQTISLWADMEGRLVEIAAILLGSTKQKTGLVLYSIMNFHAWLNIIDELFGLDAEHGGQKPTWTKLSDDLRGLNDTRVRLAHHSVWGKSKKGEDFGLKPGEYDARTKSRKYAPLSLTELVKFSDDVVTVRDRLESLLAEMGGRSYFALAMSNALLGKSAQPPSDPPEGDAQPSPTPPKPKGPPRSSET